MTLIQCDVCGRAFADETAYRIHFSYDLKPGVHVANIEQAEALHPERRRCGTDSELAGRGLVNHAWQSMNGLKDAYFTNGPS